MRRRLGLLTVLGALLAIASPAAAANRYQLVHGCYTLQAADGQSLGPFRMQATALGRYMLYSKQRDFLGAGGATVADPGPEADHEVTGSGDTFTVAGVGTFRFVEATGCPEYPEAEVNATGPVRKGATPYAGVKGYVDAHMHMMGFEFLGGNVHCGRPWSPYGVTVALKGCDTTATPDTTLTETVLTGGDPSFDQVGWPTFNDWPEHHRLTHEQSYYRWLERSWRAGQRVFVNLFVENHALCMLYPIKRNSCNEMDSVRLQAKDLRALQDYIDAQHGGPGKGWFRIVSDPFQARRVINRGKLAVIPGIEVSNLFDCGLQNGSTPCVPKDVDARLDEAYNKLGVRDMELLNKFDNGFGGVAGDGGAIGLAVNSANRYETGRFWDLETCRGPQEESDHEQSTVPGQGGAALWTAFSAVIPGGTAPVYPPPPHCNKMGLTSLGEHLVRRMMEKRMMIDPDHLSVIARKQLLAITESERYSGVVSSHSWSTADAYPRIYRYGGFVAPYAGGSAGFVNQWKALRKVRDKRFYWGIGWGADMNGFGGQGGPRGGKNPVVYPFKSVDGKVTFDRQRTGERSFDINTDGVAHYGEYADWVEDLRLQAGNRIVRDLERGSEAYLQTWERAVGVAPSNRCRQRNLGFRRTGVGLLKLGAPAEDVLRGAGQPIVRGAHRWVWCVQGRKPKGRVAGGFDKRGRLAWVASTGRHHRINGVGRGDRVPQSAHRVAKRRFARARFVFGARHGRIRFVAVARRGVSPRSIRP